jgi:dihydropteroate synthase
VPAEEEQRHVLPIIRELAPGLADDRIVLDTGIGFGKTAEQNLAGRSR